MFLKYSETYLLNLLGLCIPFHVSTYVFVIVRAHQFLFSSYYLYISSIILTLTSLSVRYSVSVVGGFIGMFTIGPILLLCVSLTENIGIMKTDTLFHLSLYPLCLGQDLVHLHISYLN